MSAEDLAAAARDRRHALGFKQSELESRGGPSVGTVRNIEQAARDKYAARTFGQLDRALHWEHGSALSLLVYGLPPTELQQTPAGGQTDPCSQALALELYRAGLLATLGASVERRVAECLARVGGAS